jgi:hypothetical protein
MDHPEHVPLSGKRQAHEVLGRWRSDVPAGDAAGVVRDHVAATASQGPAFLGCEGLRVELLGSPQGRGLDEIAR